MIIELSSLKDMKVRLGELQKSVHTLIVYYGSPVCMETSDSSLDFIIYSDLWLSIYVDHLHLIS